MSHVQEMNEILRRTVRQSILTKQQMLQKCSKDIVEIATALSSALRHGHKILLLGNGGSAADAQHVAGELVGRFLRERRALPVIALTTDTSILTAISNDYGFENVFLRQIEALLQPGDVVVGISTSGNSKAVLKAIEIARQMGAKTVGFTGQRGGQLKLAADLCLCVPSDETPRIQEAHIVVWHAICEYIEDRLMCHA
jgi:D-sedoheptulose 7-phosphate isomerase